MTVAAPAGPVITYPCAINGCTNRNEKRGRVCTASTGGTAHPAAASTPEQHAAYRNGLCINLCGRPYRIGTRCTDCHTSVITPQVKGVEA